jgi:hypothetical protein
MVANMECEGINGIELFEDPPFRVGQIVEDDIRVFPSLV